jgi:GAF domain-containing protein
MPWLHSKAGKRSSHLKCIRLPDELPVPATRDRTFLDDHNIQSGIFVPYEIDGGILGGLLFASSHRMDTYDDGMIEQIHRFRVVVIHVLEQERLLSHIETLHQLDRLMSAVSNKYLDIPFAQLEAAIREDFGRLARLLDVDRCMFYLLGRDNLFWLQLPLCWWPDEDDVDIRALYRKKQKEIVANYTELYGYLFAEWHAGRQVRFSSRDDLPEEGMAVRRLYDMYGVKSGCSVPIAAGGEIVGALDSTY